MAMEIVMVMMVMVMMMVMKNNLEKKYQKNSTELPAENPRAKKPDPKKKIDLLPAENPKNLQTRAKREWLRRSKNKENE